MNVSERFRVCAWRPQDECPDPALEEPDGRERRARAEPGRRALAAAAARRQQRCADAGAWGLMQIGAVREAVLEAAPMFVDLIAPPAPHAPPVPPPPKPQPIPKVPVIAAAPSPAPSPFTVPAPPPEPVVVAPAPPVVAAVPAPPAPPPPPKVLPASAVQYLDTPAPEYPRLSRRNLEAGRVMVRVFIDEAGLPRQAQVGKSSGFERLDAAALAAVLKFRFRPPTENGQPVSGWTNVPIDFGLEK
jgi:protein TonB